MSQYDKLITSSGVQDYKRFVTNKFLEPEKNKEEIQGVIPQMNYGGNFIKDSIQKYNLGGNLNEENEEGESFLEQATPYLNTATSIAGNVINASQFEEAANQDISDDIRITSDVKDSIKENFKQARDARGKAIGTGVGTAIGAAFGVPGLGAKAGEFVGGLVSKLRGKKFKDKMAAKIKEEEGEFFDAEQGRQEKAITQATRTAEAKEEFDYLQSLRMGKYGGNFNGMVYGPRHEEGGVMMYKDGQPIAEVEGDEYVINNDILKDKKESKKKYQITGSPLQIASALNSIKKYGVNTHPGGKVKQVS